MRARALIAIGVAAGCGASRPAAAPPPPPPAPAAPDAAPDAAPAPAAWISGCDRSEVNASAIRGVMVDCGDLVLSDVRALEEGCPHDCLIEGVARRSRAAGADVSIESIEVAGVDRASLLVHRSGGAIAWDVITTIDEDRRTLLCQRRWVEGVADADPADCVRMIGEWLAAGTE